MLSLRANILYVNLKYLPFLLLQACHLTVHAPTLQKCTRKLFWQGKSWNFNCYSKKNYMDLLGETSVNSIFNGASVTMAKRNHRQFGDYFFKELKSITKPVSFFLRLNHSHVLTNSAKQGNKQLQTKHGRRVVALFSIMLGRERRYPNSSSQPPPIPAPLRVYLL